MKDKLKNSMWMIAEKIIAVFGLIFVTSFVAKYVGPTTFGIISISLLVFQFLQTVAYMGSDVILLKRLSQNKHSGIRLMISAAVLIFTLYVVLASAGMVVMHEEMTSQAQIFIVAAAIACLFSAIDLVNVFNEAMLNAKLNVIANAIGLTISLSIRFIISYFRLDPSWLALPIVLATFIPFVIKLALFRRYEGRMHRPNTKQLKAYSRYMLASGGTLIFSVIAVALYTRLNQFSVSYFLGVKEAGVFSVALTLSGAWVFLPNALLASFYPSFFSERDPKRAIVKIQQLHLLVVIVSAVVIAAVALLAPPFIHYFYGAAYQDAVAPTVWLCLGAMFGLLSSVMDRFIIKYNGYGYLVKKTFFVLLICLVSSAVLVPLYGLTGAAFSVILTELLSFTLLNYFFAAQPMLSIHRSFLSPKKIWFLLNDAKTLR
ncbi:oligosaccharide flippase family protein [Pantoea sp. KPR_PJ]|uniref:oligosaccharide flippase family protein n=1 Tax=Pantoea sp. KPR_PJ TaxID=2738375 RepID=UPI003527BA86